MSFKETLEELREMSGTKHLKEAREDPADDAVAMMYGYEEMLSMIGMHIDKLEEQFREGTTRMRAAKRAYGEDWSVAKVYLEGKILKEMKAMEKRVTGMVRHLEKTLDRF